MVAFVVLGAGGAFAESDLIDLENLALGVEGESMGGFLDDDLVGLGNEEVEAVALRLIWMAAGTACDQKRGEERDQTARGGH